MNVSDFIAKFSFDFFRSVIKEEVAYENICVSPPSIYFVLLMIHIGARRNTSEQLSRTLGTDYSLLFNEEDDSEIYKKLWGRVKNANDMIALSTEFNNKIFSGRQLNKKYIDLVYKLFGAETERIHFDDPEKASNIINSWISDKTQGKFKKMIDPNGISESSAFLVINTIYFKSSWLNKFISEDTSKEDFYVNSKLTLDVEMMQQTNDFPYYNSEEKKYSCVTKTFEDKNLTGLFILPHTQSDLFTLISDFNEIELKHMLHSLRKIEVNIQIPKFSISQKLSAKNILSEMGVVDIFTEECDLQNAYPIKSCISDILHASKVEMNEEGVTAAAATFTLVTDGWTPEPFKFIANRPFLFIIYDYKNEYPIFLNAIFQPNKITN
ncbi:hypothetical protein HZS_6760 [Henneguya salminicola]|nr:hypothetical protein HZS_6760 [Henneguya salminicola]